MAKSDLPHTHSDQLAFGGVQNGACLFSTHNGRLPSRCNPNMSMPCIVREDPEADCMQMVANLRENFPEICAMVKRPVTYDNLYEWFDHRDACMHGTHFLLSVLSNIALENQARLYDFVIGWRAANAEAFVRMLPGHTVEHLFTPEDKEEYGLDFLTDATAEIKHMQATEKEQERNRIQEHRAQIVKDQRGLVVSQAPATAPRVASNAPRATSNPERHLFHSYPDHTRQIPPPDALFTGHTSRLPLPRLTGATELLEHIVPGATTRGDFHSDPLATLGRPYPDTVVAIPSRGFPGPYGYFAGGPVPLDDRGRKFSGNVPRGKKNPIKRSSDDARRQYDADTGHRSLPKSGISHEYPASSSQSWSQNNTQLHLTGPVQMSQVNDGPYPGHQWQGKEYKAYRYPPRMEEMGTRSLALAPRPQPENCGDASEGITSLPAANFRRIHGEINNNGFDSQRSVLANMSNSGQSQLQHSPVIRQGAGQGGLLKGGDRIWIGAIPPDFTKDMLMKLFKPCRGLRHISDPKPPSGRSAFVFATFDNPNCALEALERIPRTPFHMLPEGHTLVTNWPRTSASARGDYKDRQALDQSPAKSRKEGEYKSHRNQASLTDSENRMTTRETADVDDRQSLVGPNHRHEHSPAPNNRDTTTVPKKTDNVLPTPSGAKPVTDKVVTKVKPTALPLNLVSETNNPPQHKDTDTHTEPSSYSVALQPDANDRSRLGPPEMTDKAVPNQAPYPSSVDGSQETVPPPRTKNPNKKKNKTKFSKKTAAAESQALTTSQGLPDVEQTNLPATAEADSTVDSRSKVMDQPLEAEEHGLRNDSDRNASMKSATTGLSGPHLKSSEDNSIVTNPASAPQDTDLSLLNTPEIHSNTSNLGPSDNLQSKPTDKEHIPNEEPTSLAPIASAVPSSLVPEPESQAMTRATSMSTEYNALLNSTSTAPSSFLATERSNSIAEDSYLTSLSAHTASLKQTNQTTAGVNPEQLRSKLEAQATATTSETSDAAKGYVTGSQHAIYENVKQGKNKDDVSKKASVPATPPRPQSSVRTPTSSRSPERKQAPDIPQRSSSLLVSSTPIHTRLRKKPKNFSPVAEEAPGGATTQIDPAEEPPETQNSEPPARQSRVSSPANTSPSAHCGNSRSNKKRRANNPKANSSIVHAPTSPTPSSKRDHLPKPEMPYHIGDEDSVAVSTPATAQQALPKPERPFCADDGASLPVPNLSEVGKYNVTLEYTSVENLFSHFVSDLPSPDPPMMPRVSSKKMDIPSPLDTQSYNSRLKREIDDLLAHKDRGTTLVNGDGLVPLESQERVWGDVLSVHEYPENPSSRIGPEMWAFWAADFLRPDATQSPPFIRELGMNIKYFAGTSIRYQDKALPSSSHTSALAKEYEEGMTLVEQMPGSPWAQVTPQEWEGLAVGFRRRLMAKYHVAFPISTERPEEDTSTVIKSESRGELKQNVSAPNEDSETSVTSLLNSLTQRQAKVTEEIAHANEWCLDKSALEFESEELKYFVENSPRELTSQLEPWEWESMASHLLSQAVEPPQDDQPQKPSTAWASSTKDNQQKLLSRATELIEKSTSLPEEEGQAAILSLVQKSLLGLGLHESTEDLPTPPSLIEQAAQGYTPNSDAGSDEERAIIPSSQVTTGRKSILEERAGSSVSTTVPAEAASLMATSKYPATSELLKDNQDKQTKDVVEGLQGTETELERDQLAKSIGQGKTEGNHDKQVSRQSEVLMVTLSSEVDKALGTDAQAMNRTTEKEGENQGSTYGGELQTTQAIEPERGHFADRKLRDITIEESNQQRQATQEDHGRTTLIDPKVRAEDQRSQYTGPNVEMKGEEDVSSLAEQKRFNDTSESNEQPQKQVELREEPAESQGESRNLATTPESPEKPTNEGKDFAALESKVNDVKNDLETTDSKKDATTAFEHPEGSTQGGELSTSPSSGARFTPSSSDAHCSPPGSEAHSSPANSEAPDIEDNTKPPAKMNQVEESPLVIRGGGPNMGGRKTYAALAKEPASGGGSESGDIKQAHVKSDPWAVPEGERAWGKEKR